MENVDWMMSEQILCKWRRGICHDQSAAFRQIEEVDVALDAVTGGEEQELRVSRISRSIIKSMVLETKSLP